MPLKLEQLFKCEQFNVLFLLFLRPSVILLFELYGKSKPIIDLDQEFVQRIIKLVTLVAARIEV